MALLITASDSLAHRKIVAEIFSKSTGLQAIPSAFATKHALLKIIHAFSLIGSIKLLHSSHVNAFQNVRQISPSNTVVERNELLFTIIPKFLPSFSVLKIFASIILKYCSVHNANLKTMTFCFRHNELAPRTLERHALFFIIIMNSISYIDNIECVNECFLIYRFIF